MIYSIYTDYRDSEIRGYLQERVPKGFARAVVDVVDVWARPLKNLKLLKDEVKNSYRATQVTRQDPTVEVLSPVFEGWVLVRLWEGTVGWVQEVEIEMTPGRVVPHEPLLTPEQFLERYRAAPYLRGGTTQKGIDCSGLIQRYFIEVMGKQIPRHSTDQWKVGDKVQKDTATVGDVLALRHRLTSRDHVGLLWGDVNTVLHSCLDHHGVTVEPLKDVVSRYDLLHLTRIL